MKDILLATVLVVGVLTIFSYSAGEDTNKEKDENKQLEVREMSHDLQLFTPITEVNKLEPFVKRAIIWPDEKTIKQKRMNPSDDFTQYKTRRQLRSLPWPFTHTSVRGAIQNTEHWTKKVIKPEWIPEDITGRMLPLKESYLGKPLGKHGKYEEKEQLCDAIWLRYEVKDKYYIQIISTSSRLTIFIKPTKKGEDGKPDNEKAIKTMVKEKIEEFFLEADKIEECSLDKKPVKEKVGWRGTPNPQKIKDGFHWWWGKVKWWTNGKIIMFSIQKDDPTRPRKSSLHKHWFSPPPKPKEKDK